MAERTDGRPKMTDDPCPLTPLTLCKSSCFMANLLEFYIFFESEDGFVSYHKRSDIKLCCSFMIILDAKQNFRVGFHSFDSLLFAPCILPPLLGFDGAKGVNFLIVKLVNFISERKVINKKIFFSHK